MPSCINLVVLSGEVGWVKIKYTSANKTYVHFGIKQPELIYENNVVVSKSYNYIFISCFDMSILTGKQLKEGVYVTVQGKLNSYQNSDKKANISIIAEKIDIQNKQD
jgi:RecG-like helicase